LVKSKHYHKALSELFPLKKGKEPATTRKVWKNWSELGVANRL